MSLINYLFIAYSCFELQVNAHTFLPERTFIFEDEAHFISALLCLLDIISPMNNIYKASGMITLVNLVYDEL